MIYNAAYKHYRNAEIYPDKENRGCRQTAVKGVVDISSVVIYSKIDREQGCPYGGKIAPGS